MEKNNGGLVEVDVEVWANRRLESSEQHNNISLRRNVMIVISNSIVYLSNL
jgi:hypothetical protein